MINTYSIMTFIMKGANNLDNSNQKPVEKSNRLMELMILNVLQKHGITSESVKEKLTEDQKKLFLDMLEELKQQTDILLSKNTSQKSKSNWSSIPFKGASHRRFFYIKIGYKFWELSPVLFIAINI